MQSEGLLALFANISVVFAGFTGLVGVVGRDRTASGAAAQQTAARFLVEYGVAILIQSMLPLVLWHTGVPEPVAWRLAAGVTATGTTLYYFCRITDLKQSLPKQFWPGFAVDWVFATILAIGAVGFRITPWLPAIYLSFLFWNLVGTALSFVHLIRPLWQDTE